MSVVNEIKLLSPAGSEDIAYGAFEAGADAVYIGPKGWSRRISGYEVDDEALKRCIEYANENGKEIHIPLNNYYQGSQVRFLVEKVRKYVEWGVSVLIVTDIGLINELHKNFPELRLCASVSTGPSNAYSVKFLKELGCSQFVAQLNAPPEEIARIKENVDIKAEVFAHGFLDFNQCGRCWMSTYANLKKEENEDKVSYFYDGSVNRGGGCYRVCHREWDLVDADGAVLTHKDTTLRTLHQQYRVDTLAQYVQAGAEYFKIQGRTYSKEVILDLTRFYRKLLDKIAVDPGSFQPDEEILEEIKGIAEKRDKQQTERTNGLVRKAGIGAK